MFTVVAAKMFLGALVALFVWLVVTRKLRFPLLIELGMACIAIATWSALDALVTDFVSTQEQTAARWLLAGFGFALIVAQVAWRCFKHPGLARRVTDHMDLDDKPLKRDFPPSPTGPVSSQPGERRSRR